MIKQTQNNMQPNYKRNPLLILKNSDEMKDFLYLSKNETFRILKRILNKGIIVVSDLHDKNGKFNQQIIGVENNFEDETCIVSMKSGETHKLHDKYLYNIIYNIKKEKYYLEEQDEYFEKIIAI